jgi:flagellar basal body-associated protein FliL
MVKIATISNSKPWRIVYLALLSLAGVLVVLLIIGTIVGLARPQDAQPLFRLGKPAETEETVLPQAQNDDIRVYSGLGRLRIPLSNSSTMILSIAFPYNAADVAFTEELAAKIGEFRDIATGYFSSLPADRLTILNEEIAKIEILKLYNASLRLGRIEALYFSDMNIIDGNP